MKCPNCGFELPDTAKFCTKCGGKLEGTEKTASASQKTPADTNDAGANTDQGTPDVPAEGDTSAGAAQAATGKPEAKAAAAGAAKRFKSLDKKKRYGILGALAAVIVIIVVICAVSCSGVPTDAVKQAFAESDLARNGAVSANYTNATPYEITSFKVDGQEGALSSEERSAAEFLYGTKDLQAVTCSGTIANESFETEFSAVVYLGKIDGTWTALGTPDILNKSTKPLKGVDALYRNGESSTEAVSYTDFSSTLDETNGGYSSTATGTVTHEFWFATDTETCTQNFTFDPDSGWKAQGDLQSNGQRTQWNLNGKTFELDTDNNNATLAGNITFGEGKDNQLTATYKIDYAPKAGASNSMVTYKKFSLNGTAKGTPVHEFGKDDFSVELNDSGKSVTLACERTTQSTVAGGGTVDALYVSIYTEQPYRTWKLSNSSDDFEATYVTFTEKTS